MTQSNTVTVHILDKEYCIACPQDERANLESAARYLDGKMREIRTSGKVIGADRVAVMAALNITHDLLHKQQRLDQDANSTRQQVRDLLDRDSGLAVPRDADHVVTELGGIGLWHDAILPGHPPGQARSDVTYPCSSPQDSTRSSACPSLLRLIPPGSRPKRPTGRCASSRG